MTFCHKLETVVNHALLRKFFTPKSCSRKFFPFSHVWSVLVNKYTFCQHLENEKLIICNELQIKFPLYSFLYFVWNSIFQHSLRECSNTKASKQLLIYKTVSYQSYIHISRQWIHWGGWTWRIPKRVCFFSQCRPKWSSRGWRWKHSWSY